MNYLDKLNPDQRRAVEHGVADGDARPLLIIAGAGSGKTDTLAHRVAHLVMTGADPHRILLLTFSRRAAAEMERRTERILNRASGTNASAVQPMTTYRPATSQRGALSQNICTTIPATANGHTTPSRMRALRVSSPTTAIGV